MTPERIDLIIKYTNAIRALIRQPSLETMASYEQAISELILSVTVV